MVPTEVAQADIVLFRLQHRGLSDVREEEARSKEENRFLKVAIKILLSGTEVSQR